MALHQNLIVFEANHCDHRGPALPSLPGNCLGCGTVNLCRQRNAGVTSADCVACVVARLTAEAAAGQ